MHNANVFYELGVRHALRKEPTVLIKSSPSADATVPRFPAAAEARAAELIETALKSLRNDSERLLVLASGAPGADSLALEACARLKIETQLCLPMGVEAPVYMPHAAWREPLLALMKAHKPDRMLVLQHEAELPTWMRMHSKQSSWERGNRWMINLAQFWGVQQVTLLTLWDGNAQDPSTAGTAQLVRMARKTKSITTRVIDYGELLAG